MIHHFYDYLVHLQIISNLRSLVVSVTHGYVHMPLTSLKIGCYHAFFSATLPLKVRTITYISPQKESIHLTMSNLCQICGWCFPIFWYSFTSPPTPNHTLDEWCNIQILVLSQSLTQPTAHHQDHQTTHVSSPESSSSSHATTLSPPPSPRIPTRTIVTRSQNNIVKLNPKFVHHTTTTPSLPSEP